MPLFQKASAVCLVCLSLCDSGQGDNRLAFRGVKSCGAARVKKKKKRGGGR